MDQTTKTGPRFGFEDQEFGVPDPCPAAAPSSAAGDNLDCVVEGMNKIVDAFVSKGGVYSGAS